MAQASAGRVRFSGFFLIICAAVLLGIGSYLLFVALSWTMPDWVPKDWQFTPRGPALTFKDAQNSPVGLSALYVLLFGVVGGLGGLHMVIYGRRNWLLTTLLILLFLIFVVVGAWATVDPTGFGQMLEKISAGTST